MRLQLWIARVARIGAGVKLVLQILSPIGLYCGWMMWWGWLDDL